ncbi:serine hydrolase domain-containing protein [Christiangramia forsetii]|uniref:Secreted beta-lactamase family protein n=2 Tax=Christiangramia forsetii TaxID=411153 RepID=A0M3D2_CHRFK|nr:serine hydrolase domain-containing protein [Christiangramia forsetii]GGG26132.1 hypothetical protein GCM10011532_06940 [Christiangramia forsetii]CAL67127.1 secreted beta-lactamase family protein [Christiangramia forsetii KT0803]
MKNQLSLLIGILLFNYGIGQSNSSINDLEVSGAQISEKQADIIFEKTKIFPDNTQLSIGIIKNGKILYYGVKRSGDTLQKVDNYHDIFEIGSLTKLFTSTLLANFVLEDKIKLKDPIQKYFNFQVANDQVTVLQLANHTSGLPKLPSNLNLAAVDQSNPYKDYDEQKLIKYLTSELEIITTPGTKYEYSNIGAGILGYLLEVQSHLTYEELLQKYILSKYNMHNTTTNNDKINLKLVYGLDLNGKKTSNWNLNSLVAAGGILSNIEDLSKFAVAQFSDTNEELHLTRRPTFEQQEYKMETGLAWKIIKPDANINIYAHNGGTGGYSSMITLDTRNKKGVIILSNVSAFHNDARNIDQLCIQLLKTLYTK